jgi:hypothetical protein
MVLRRRWCYQTIGVHMNIQDLPLPLRLRNALLRAGFQTDDDLRSYFDQDTTVIPGVGATGMAQLTAWYNEAPTAAPESMLIEAETPEEAVAKGVKHGDVVRRLRDQAMRQRIDDAADYDAGMRGGLEQSKSRPLITNSGDVVALFHASGGSVDVRSGENAEKAAQFWRKAAEADAEADFAEQWDAYRGELAKRGAWVETKTGQPGRNMLILNLETDIQARVTALIPTIKALPHVKELGVEVSAETVGRMALIRGLDALERAHGAKNQAEKPAETAKTVENREPTLPTGDEEVFETPEGWTKCGPTDKIPVPEAVLHDYYTQNGWFRYWGMVDGQPIYFYWCPERRLQELGIFPGTDKSGRKMAVQETPWGPGHVVPAKWTNS